MPCYHPLMGWWSKDVNASGKRSIVFQKSEALVAAAVYVPCGRCVGCCLERSRQWAIRCYHESTLFANNAFVTLTYDDEHLPMSSSLVKAHFQNFMKRLRKRFGSGVRYFMCGEYGSKFSRPHYHACLFNFDFPDKIYQYQYKENKVYSSAILAELWPHGFTAIGEVTFESAAYVARYLLKKLKYNKVYPKAQAEYYQGREPEYVNMSRRPGIGKVWFEEFSSDVYPHGYVVIRGGIKCKPPAYYEKIFDLTNSQVFDKVRLNREKKAFNSPDNSPARLEAREFVQLQRAKMLERSYESENVYL